MADSIQALPAIRSARIQGVSLPHGTAKLIDGAVLQAPAVLLKHAAPGDELAFTDEALVRSDSEVRLRFARRLAARELYQSYIQFVGQPKRDTRDEWFL